MLLLTLDSETTGVDPFQDRLVTFYAGVYDTDTQTFSDQISLLVDPGVEIPQTSIDVHGITNEYAFEYGLEPVQALTEIEAFLTKWKHLPMVAMNASFDLTVLKSEFARYNFAGFDFTSAHIIDPMVVDRAMDKWRKGPRKLENLAEVYGVPVNTDATHEAKYDAELAVRVTANLINKFGIPTVAQQVVWYREWADNFEKFLISKGAENPVVNKNWPVR